MASTFEKEKNKKALAYTTLICGMLLLMAIFISWQTVKPPVPVVQDLIEINLGNEQEGEGDVQPLIKGEKAPATEPAQQEPTQETSIDKQPEEDINTDASKDDKEAVSVVKKTTTIKPAATSTPVTVPAEPKPQKPKIAGYNGPTNGTGNGANEDNGYRYQGNKPGGKGDVGSPDGNPDSYGKNRGGRIGGLRVSKGDRTIVNNYSFQGDLPKAVINAIIKVSPEGRGTFVAFDKGSTSSDSRYANAIRSYLPNIQFNKSDHESVVTVPFNFTVQ